jgi:hypothetical protein
MIRGDDDLRYVFTALVRCPACGSTDFKVYGHRKGEPKTQYARCTGEGCAHKFLIVFEDEIQRR